MTTCLYQGIQGSYSHQAAMHWNAKLHLKGVKTFEEVFCAVHNQEADYGFIPLENSLAGSIYENYDLFQAYPCHILAEVYQKVDHCLVSHEQDLSKVKTVFSHPKALEQCLNFFKEHPWIQKVVHFDTAAAAEEVARTKEPGHAAIASLRAAQIYGLNTLKQSIQDVSENYTRFACIAKNIATRGEDNKCSLMLALPHQVGALLNALKLFAIKGMNLTKIESRPLKTEPFEYIFYIDCEIKEKGMFLELIEDLKKVTHHVKLLGLYQAGCL